MKTKLTKNIKIFLFLILVINNVGCLNSLQVKEINTYQPEDLREDEAVVFGRFVLTDNGKKKEVYQSFTEQLDLILVRIEDRETIALKRINSDGSFAWSLPRGTYLITRMKWWEFLGPVPFYPQLAFQIGDESNVYYLGAVEVNLKIKRGLLTIKLESFNVAVLDKYEDDLKIMIDRQFDPSSNDLEKALMIHSSLLPMTTVTAQKRGKTEAVLRTLGLVLQNIF